MIDWNDYRYFLAVAETGSLSAAARKLDVAQPTVGRRIQALETSLQARLFDRLSHGYVLTTAGEEIQALVVDMEKQALAVERRVAGADKQPSGRVCISTTEGLGYWLAGKLSALQENYPQLEIELAVGIGMIDLLRREADIALRVGKPGSDELIGRNVGKISVGLFAAKNYLAEHGSPQQLRDLSTHIIIESTREISNLAQAQWLRQHGNPKISFCSNNITIQLAAAQAGLGIVALPVYYLNSGTLNLQRILPDEFNLKLDLWLLTHQDLRPSARIRAVMSFITDMIKQDKIALSGPTR